MERIAILDAEFILAMISTEEVFENSNKKMAGRVLLGSITSLLLKNRKIKGV